MADTTENSKEEVAEVVEKTEEPEKPTAVAQAAEEEEKAAEEEENGDAAKEKVEETSAGEENGDLTKLEKQIIRQVEYYFSDANLNRDKFLLGKINEAEGGWVPLSVLVTFKRLAQLSTDAEVIVSALAKSNEGLLEISEDREKVRRHPERPIPEHNDERRQEIMSRTAYAKGFPLDTDMEKLLDYFAPYEKVVNISMRKYFDKPNSVYKFKGSVFVTFDKKEQAQEFIEKEKVLYEERELTRKWQDKYLAEKREEMEKKNKNKKNKPAKEEKEKKEINFTLPKGALVHFEGANEDLLRENLKDEIQGLGAFEVAYIDFTKGDKEGHVRFQEEGTATKFLEKLEDNKLTCKESALSFRSVTEEEEQKFLEKALEYMRNRRNNSHQFKRGKRYGQHSNNHRNSKRRKI